MAVQGWPTWRDHAPDWMRLWQRPHTPESVLGDADLGHARGTARGG